MFEILSCSSQIDIGIYPRYFLSYMIRPEPLLKTINVNNEIYFQSDFVTPEKKDGKIQAYVNIYNSTIGKEYLQELSLPENVLGFVSCHDARGNEPIKIFYEIQLSDEVFRGIEMHSLKKIPDLFSFDVELSNGTSFIDDWIKDGVTGRFPRLQITNFFYKNTFGR